ncbi:MAG TPA: hypothetical protein EYG68_06315 [Leucothrix mucor]|nr:hypothetical protein [Leucothrix mucor]
MCLSIGLIIKRVSLIAVAWMCFVATVAASPLFYADNVTFNKSGSQLIYTNPAASLLTVIEARTGKILRQLKLKNLPKNALMIGATPDGFKLLYLDAKGLSVIHNGTGKVLRTLAHPHGYQAVYKRHLMAQNTNGSLIAIPYKHGNKYTLFMIHTGSGKVIHQLALPVLRPANQNPIEAITFSVNNRLLAYTRHSRDDKGRAGSMLHIYDLYAKKELQAIFLVNHRYRNHAGAMPIPSNRIQFSRDNQKIALVFPDKVTVVDSKTGSFNDFPARNADAVFNSNNQSLIYKSSLAGTSPIIINMRSGKNQKMPLTPAMKKQSLAFIQSADKRWIAIPLLNKKNGAADFLVLNGQTGALVK